MLVSCLSRHYPSDAAPAIFYAADLAARRIGEDDGDDDLAAAMREVDAATPLNSDAVFIAAAHRLMQSPPLVKTVRRDDGRTAWVCAAHQDLPHYRAVDGAATTLRYVIFVCGRQFSGSPRAMLLFLLFLFRFFCWVG